MNISEKFEGNQMVRTTFGNFREYKILDVNSFKQDTNIIFGLQDDAAGFKEETKVVT